jgi:hypothetical protein
MTSKAALLNATCLRDGGGGTVYFGGLNFQGGVVQIDISHSKDPAAGWDVDVTVTGEKDETIASVKIVVNGFPEWEEKPPGEPKKWHKGLLQQGVYPGENKVVVTVLDQDANQSSAVDEWE